VDVAVIGGGITGLTAAVLLRDQGARVAVIDRHRIATGTTGNTTAKVTSLHALIYAHLVDTYGEEHARLYGEANQAALELVASLVRRLSIDCDFYRLPAYTFATSEESLADVTREVEVATHLGLPAGFVASVPLPVAARGAVRFDNQAIFHPRKYCLALAEHINGDGSYIFEETTALSVDDDPCMVRTNHGAVEADQVIVATLLPFMQAGLFYARTYPSRSYALAASIEGDAPAGMFLGIDAPGRSVRPYPGAGSGTVIIEGEQHKTGQVTDTEQFYAALKDWAREHFAVRSIEYQWSAQDYMTGDRVPYVGRIMAGHDRIWTATGFNKWGMSNGTAAAIMLADALGGRDNPWLRLYDDTASKLRASAPTLIKENLDVASHLVGDRLKAVRVPDARDLSFGQAELVSLDGETVAGYRDDDGSLHAVSPACTHMGCLLHWNDAERTWDCPCHGSRFTYDGAVIEGPATANLAPKPS
jgi:glycine/D-amino acid oxidase-like deaminating enzyme/nitrite reductase/ring-hydroxylating ferredoxin subunit